MANGTDIKKKNTKGVYIPLGILGTIGSGAGSVWLVKWLVALNTMAATTQQDVCETKAKVNEQITPRVRAVEREQDKLKGEVLTELRAMGHRLTRIEHKLDRE